MEKTKKSEKSQFFDHFLENLAFFTHILVRTGLKRTNNGRDCLTPVD